VGETLGEPEIRFTSAGGRRIAWASIGSGPTVVIGGWWCSHLELQWADRAFRRFIELLATGRRVVWYDRPGSGLSDRDGQPQSLDQEVDVLHAVVTAVGEVVHLFGASSGGPIAARYAADLPDRLRSLVLYGTYADGRQIAPEAVRESLVKVVRSHWGLGSRVLADVFLPGAGPAERDRFARFQRESSSATTAAASLELVYALDVREDLHRITTPTRVLHRREDRAIPAELGRQVAALVPGATFILLSGEDHFPWRGDSGAVTAQVGRFLTVVDDGNETSSPALLPPALAALSNRELEVLRLVAAGLGDREIATALVISPHTVHRHLANIRFKLGLTSRASAAALAARSGLV
jgi:pimeloyl-ACP methyl ester carboxylesterase/DNA-binding CsgD family transcriptional regulator